MANEKRLIDANAAIAELKENVCKNCNGHNEIRCDYCWADAVIDFLQDSPTVDAVEVVHGRWEERIVDHEIPYYTVVDCSLCGCSGERWHTYCPNCGAKMDGGNEDAER